MKQSTFHLPGNLSAPTPTEETERKIHAAIIMDGNGRWATALGLGRSQGHRAGVETVRRIVRCAPECGIGTLTLYAFSADNWRRPPTEVGFLMKLLRVFLRREVRACIANGVRLELIGRRDRLSAELRAVIEQVESITANGRALHLRLAVDYSSRQAIVDAAGRTTGSDTCSRESFAQRIGDACHSFGGAPDVDLLIRTGGEQRLSDFLLWESAYAELVFTRRMWPEFSQADLRAAVAEFSSRQRRFGAIDEQQSEAHYA